jgi:hypothetical protein
MRWTDVPPDPGPADGRASALPRGEWEELRRRLERLPEGHPSRPDDAAGTAAIEEQADESGDLPGPPEPVAPGDGEDAEPHRRARGRGAADSGHARPGGLGDLGGRGEREPYRPWFTDGEPPDPWFAGEPG